MTPEKQLLMSWVQETIAERCTEVEQQKVGLVLNNPSPEIQKLLTACEEILDTVLHDLTADVLNGALYAEGLQ